jgi:hypothetical protein
VPGLNLPIGLALCYGFVTAKCWGRYSAVAYNTVWLALYGLAGWWLFSQARFTTATFMLWLAIVAFLIGLSLWLLTGHARRLLVATAP